MNIHSFTVTVNEIYDPHRDGVDLGRLFELSERKKTSARPLLPTTTPRKIPFPSFLSGLVGSRRGSKTHWCHICHLRRAPA